MYDQVKILSGILFFSLITLACNNQPNPDGKKADMEANVKENEKPVRLMTLDPGHFHAYLVQKSMYDKIDPVVNVYAPQGAEVEAHQDMINQYNSRTEKPTRWEQKVYLGEDYLEKMIEEKPGNVMMVAGNNAKKTEYIHKAVRAGINVFADKPMVIKPDKFTLLEEAFKIAEEKGILIYDIMTERYEITTILQKELSGISDVFGKMEKGSPDNPAISKESVHHFYKYVSGKPLKRPAWFFDVEQEGAGIVDVSTHLVDLIMWECFPEEGIARNEVEVVKATQWGTQLTLQQFKKVTDQDAFPDYLMKNVDKNLVLNVNSNGEFVFTTRGVHGKVSVIWNFQAPEGAKDSHFSIMRGTKSNLVIRQEEEQGYKPTLYVEPLEDHDTKEFEQQLKNAMQDLRITYPGLSFEQSSNGWKIVVPQKYRIGHEAHFRQVTEKYLKFLEEGKIPEWEKMNMLTKYYVTMEAYKKSL